MAFWLHCAVPPSGCWEFTLHTNIQRIEATEGRGGESRPTFEQDSFNKVFEEGLLDPAESLLIFEI